MLIPSVYFFSMPVALYLQPLITGGLFTASLSLEERLIRARIYRSNQEHSYTFRLGAPNNPLCWLHLALATLSDAR